jgi:beta-lactam-binding protein with PASTA domain
MRGQSHSAITLFLAVIALVAGHSPRVTVPPVVGKTWQAAELKLGAAGLRSVLRTAPSKQPAGIVVAQSPAARTVVARGTLVRLSVPASSRAAVPQLSGLQTAAAQRRLRQLGLAARVTYVKSLQPVGTVVAQSVKGGLEVALGTRVTISISSGPGP